MYLKRLEIQGFKSFARKTVLEFEKGIIAVVGPNGSGKSNFSDAIRWVLGEQSMKAVRSKKSEDVIFAGSDKKSKLGGAEVSIAFDNEDRRLPIDYSEVEIGRRVFRNGESDYILNKQAVRLMDVVELLAKSGYGNNSYHVISQGSIDQMIIAGPSAIKNLIEEACGVKAYYLKRERAARKLERSDQNLLRVADLIAEIEPRLRSLKRQAKRMEQREEIHAQLRQAQVSFYSGAYRDIQKSLEEFESQVKYFDEDLGKLNEEIESADAQIKKLEEHTFQKSQGYAKLQENLRRQEKEKNRLQEELATIHGKLKVKAPLQAADPKALKMRQQEIGNKIKELENQMEDLRRQTVLGEKNLLDHQKIYEKLQGEISTLLKSVDSSKNPFDLNKLKDDIDKIYSRFQLILYDIKNFKSEEDLSHLQQDASNLEIILVKLKDRFTQVTSVQMNHSELLHLNSQLQKVYSQKEQLAAEIARISAETAAARSAEKFYASATADLKSELASLERESRQVTAGGADAQWDELSEQEKTLNEELQKYFSLIRQMEGELNDFVALEAREKKELLDLERKLRQKQDLLAKIKDQKGLVLIEKARRDAHLESLLLEVRQNLSADFLEKIKTLPAATEAGLEQKIQKLKAQLELIGGVDDLTLQEYKETEQRYNHLTSESKDLRTAIDDLKKVIVELDTIIKKQFSEGFDRINDQFSEYFRILFSGGRARMTQIKEVRTSQAVEGDADGGPADAEAVEEELETQVPTGREEVTGIDVRATPPGKKLTHISALSGGERTLTAIALLMAILTAFPSPFVVLDEVDAALDEANSIRFGKILSRLSHQTQFITITHNRETMRQANIIYGVTMGDEGISRVLSIKLDHAVEIAQ
ncbi:MAG: AAA family ATPase [Patescibacteria group bacterium]